MAPTRNLVIGCDGTWNDTDSDALTNVDKILRACLSKNQVTHYEEGVGTAHWESLPGGIYGKGLDRQILGGYRFLQKRFADTDWQREDNKVFIFGFSRGAYAARRLAGLISFCGVPAKAEDVELAWQLYLKRDHQSTETLKENARLFAVSVEMLGVWDTVKTTTDEDFNDNKIPDCVVAGYHAMAIDERRNFFQVLRWNKNDRVTQMWFAGVHSDIGGGYTDCGMADIVLKWMIDRAYGHGLKFKASAVRPLNSDAAAKVHESYQGIWKPFGARRRFIADSAKIHESVRERTQALDEYRPPNLPAEPNYENS
jgi:uncharacterized protein (DUF2235 family)